MAFENNRLQPGIGYFGHWVEYNEAATQDPIDQVRNFCEINLQANEDCGSQKAPLIGDGDSDEDIVVRIKTDARVLCPEEPLPARAVL